MRVHTHTQRAKSMPSTSLSLTLERRVEPVVSRLSRSLSLPACPILVPCAAADVPRARAMGPCMDHRRKFTRGLPPEQRMPRTRVSIRISHFLTVVRLYSTNTDRSNTNCGVAILTAVRSSLLCNNPDIGATILTVVFGGGSGGTDCHVRISDRCTYEAPMGPLFLNPTPYTLNPEPQTLNPEP